MKETENVKSRPFVDFVQLARRGREKKNREKEPFVNLAN